MTIDATFWVMISFFLFVGLLIYFQVPQKIRIILDENIVNIKKQIDEADKLKEDAKNILTEHEKKISNSKAEVKSMIVKASEEAEKNIIKTNKDFHNLMENRKKNAEERIKQLKNRLKKQHNQKNLNRYSRKKSKNKLVSLIGYTNAGKTSLFNKLTGQNLYAADMPFATLDATTRKNTTPGIDSILFSDTVGFISDLPTQLIESFKGTLDELRSADLLLHVVDTSDSDADFKKTQVNKLLKDLKADSIPQLMVNNKCDLTNVDDLIIPKVNDFESWVSAKENTGIEDLKEKINNHFNEGIYKGWISIDSSAGKLRSRLFALGCVDEEKVSNEQIYLSITMGIKLLNEFMQNEDLQLIEIDTTASKVS